MKTYNSKALRIEFAAPWVKSLVCTIFSIVFGILFTVIPNSKITIIYTIHTFSWVPFAIAFVLSIITAFLFVKYTEDKAIKNKLIYGLYFKRNRNPLNLHEGDYVPEIRVYRKGQDKYIVRIYATGVTIETLEKLGTNISSILNKKHQRYAVTITVADEAMNYVEYLVEDVTIDKSLTFTSVNQMKPRDKTQIVIQRDIMLDLRYSGSILFMGKTRSGKTTAIISIILQILLLGRDKYNSRITIIDPKNAELSQLPYTYSLDEDGTAKEILKAMHSFEETMRHRQHLLNLASQTKGDVVHWWDMDFMPCVLFIDEYIALKSIFPKKPEKGSNYCVSELENSLKRIITMGQSSGMFTIISTAEASVEEGGLPSMLRNALTTKILLKPTLQEARLIWDVSKFENQRERAYTAGEAWFTSTDGEHDNNVYFIKFSNIQFPLYRELGRALKEYYENERNDDGGTPQDGVRREQNIEDFSL